MVLPEQNRVELDNVITEAKYAVRAPVGKNPLVLSSTEPLHRRIDYTCLNQFATVEDIRDLCQVAIQRRFRAVCVTAKHVAMAEKILRNEQIKVVSVVGFPLGNTLSQVKVVEADYAVKYGADEIDFVPCLDHPASESFAIHDEVQRIVALGVPVKVILEIDKVPQTKWVFAAVAAMSAGASCLKTSTGFCMENPITIEQVQKLRYVAKSFGNIAVKAAGGIKTREAAQSLVSAGADLIGTSTNLF